MPNRKIKHMLKVAVWVFYTKNASWFMLQLGYNCDKDFIILSILEA